MVNIYSETPVIDVTGIIDSMFGSFSSPVVYDLAILLCFIIFFIFLFCILGLLFRGPKK